eukprot:g71405.t1
MKSSIAQKLVARSREPSPHPLHSQAEIEYPFTCRRPAETSPTWMSGVTYAGSNLRRCRPPRPSTTTAALSRHHSVEVEAARQVGNPTPSDEAKAVACDEAEARPRHDMRPLPQTDLNRLSRDRPRSMKSNAHGPGNPAGTLQEHPALDKVILHLKPRTISAKYCSND